MSTRAAQVTAVINIGELVSRMTSMPFLAVRLLGVLFVAACLATLVACGSDDGDKAPTLNDPSRTGTELVEHYMSLLAAKDVDGLGDFLSDAFLRQGAEGSFYSKEQYLQNLPQIGDYSISDVTARQSGDALVVRWLFAVTEVIDGRTLSSEPTPRLATFVWTDGEWRLLSHANFNPPESRP